MTDEVCLNAQQVISAAMDRAPVEATDLAAAKEHCRTCEECSRFVTGLGILKRVEMTEVPDETIDRTLATIARIRAEEPRTEPARVAEPASQERRQTRPAWVFWTGWATAAAAFVVVAMLITANGLTYMMKGPPSATRDTAGSETTVQENAGTLAGAPEVAPEQEAQEGADAGDAEATTESGSRYITFNDFVYLLGETGVAQAPGTPTLGSLRVDLGDGPRSRLVFDGESQGTIVLQDTATSYYTGTIVTRTRGETTYALRSAPIETLGQWPSLPARFAEPTANDGSPTFEPYEETGAGGTVFVVPGTDANRGFAMAPGTVTAGSGPANPNWTWWEPVD